jgi:hypothetical protein
MKSKTQPLQSKPRAPLPVAYNQRWSWVQFTCAFVLVGALAFLHVASPPFDGLAVHLVKTFVIAGGCGFLAGRFGDSAWRGIVAFFAP